jgi:hypothetical protein
MGISGKKAKELASIEMSGAAIATNRITAIDRARAVWVTRNDYRSDFRKPGKFEIFAQNCTPSRTSEGACGWLTRTFMGQPIGRDWRSTALEFESSALR